MRMSWFSSSLVLASLVGLFGCSSEETKPEARLAILLFEADPQSIEAGEAVSLRWKTSNAAEVQLFGGAKEITLEGVTIPEGSVSLTPSQTTSYRLVAIGAAGNRVEKSLSVEVSASSSLVFSADPEVITFGEGSTLRWDAGDAEAVEITDGTDQLLDPNAPASGETNVTPSVTTTYVLSASNTGSSPRTASTTVGVKPVVIEFATVAEGPFLIGEEIELRWKTGGALLASLSTEEGESVTIENDQIAEGQGSILLGESGEIVLTVRSGDFEAHRILEVELQEPTIVSFEASANAVSIGYEVPKRVTLSWNTTAAARISLEAQPGITFEPEGNEVELPITQTTVFVLTAENAAGSVTDELEVRGVPLPEVSLSAAQRVEPGAAFDVEWEVTGASSIELLRDGVAIEGVGETEFVGIVSETIAEATAYVLRAYNELGDWSEKRWVVTVGAPEIFAFLGDRERFAPGATVTFSWESQGGSSLVLRDADGAEQCSMIDLGQIEVGSCTVQAPQELGFYSYTLHVENGLAESDEATFQIEVYEGPRVLALTAEPDRTTAGQFVTLRWEVENDAYGRAPTLDIYDPLEDLHHEVSPAEAAAGEKSLAFFEAGSRALVLTASTPDTLAGSRSVDVEVLAEPTVKLSASIETYESEPAILTWTSQDAVSIAIYALDDDLQFILPAVYESTELDEVAGKDVSVEVVPAPPETIYRAVVSNELGATGQASVIVGREPVEIVSFTASKTEIITTLDEVEFNWETKRASQVWIDPYDFQTSDEFIDISESPTAVEPVYATIDCDIEALEDDPYECGAFDFPDGFTFPYFEEVHDKARVSRNGFLSFDLRYGKGLDGPQAMPGVVGSAAQLAPFWLATVFQPATAGASDPRIGRIFYDLQSDDSGRRLVIQWKNMILSADRWNNPPQTALNFQLILWENGNFDYRYGELKVGNPSNLRNAGIGYQNRAGDEGYSLKGMQKDHPGGMPAAFAMRPAGLEPNGSWKVRTLREGPYTLVATDGANVRTQPIAFVVHPRLWVPAGAAPYARPNQPKPGDTVALYWPVVQSAVTLDIMDEDANVLCHIDDANRLSAPDGCDIVENRQGEIPYTFKFSGSGGEAMDNVAILPLVVPVYPIPSIDQVRLTPESILPGEQATLSWKALEATKMEITEKPVDGPAVALDLSGVDPRNGQIQVSPEVTSTYTLKVSYADSTSNKTATRTITLPIRTVRVDTVTASKTTAKVGEPVTISWTDTGEGNVHMVPAPFHPTAESFIDLSGDPGATTVSLTSSVNLTNPSNALINFPSGFSFRYFGTPYTSVRAFSTGVLGFNAFSGGPVSRFAVGTTTPAVHMSAFWGHIQPYSKGKIFWKRFQTESEDYLVIQFSHWQLDQGAIPEEGTETDDLNFQMILYNDGPNQDGRFDFRYGTMRSDTRPEDAQGGIASIGFQDQTALKGADLSSFRPVSGGLSNRAWRFIPPNYASGSLEVRPWKTTEYKVCTADATVSDCKTVRVFVPTPGDLLISEIQLSPNGGDGMQWFEVRNNTFDPIDLEGMTILADGGSKVIANGSPLVVQPGAYLTFAAGASPGFTPDYVYGTDLVLSRTSDHLQILSGTAPEVALADAAWSGWNVRQGRSLSLDSGKHRPGALSDRDESNWCEESKNQYTTNNFGTPGTGSEGCLSPYYTIDGHALLPFIDIEATGTHFILISNLPGNQSTGQVPGGLGFEMPYFDATVSELWLAKSGIASFGELQPNQSYQPRPIQGGSIPTPGGAVGSHWTPWNANAESSVRYQLQDRDGKKVMIVQWSRVGFTTNVSSYATFQTQFWENGDIVFAYKSLGGNSATLGHYGTVGIESVGAADGFQYSYLEQILEVGRSISFKRK